MPGPQGPPPQGMPPGPQGPPPAGMPPQGPPPTADTEAAPEGPTTAPQPVKVDLLPPVYRERIKLRSARRRTVLLLVGVLAAVMVGFMLASLRVGVATEARNAAEAEKAVAQDAVRQLSDVPRVMGLITEVTTGLETALSGEVLFSELTAEVARALPSGTTVDSLTWTLAEPADTAVAAQEGEVDLGDLALAGQLCGFTGSSTLISSLSAVPQLTNVWVSSVSLVEGDPGAASACGGQPQYTFAATADLSEQALSNRYLAEKAAADAAVQDGQTGGQ